MKCSLLILSFILFSCASQTTPTGGPKDETPPKLTSSNPKHNETKFAGKTIELSFSESIKLNNPKEEIIITPPAGKKTDFTAKNNKLIIKPELDWKENTTYTINFREGVQDITESNEALNLKLAFSTGTYLDSLTIAGKISEAYTEKIPDKITVALFASDTFNIFEHSPDYFTKADKEGNFTISNLKPGSYRIYAFEDKNKNLHVESKTEKFAFKADPIDLKKNTMGLPLRLVNIDSRPLELTSMRTQSDINTIRFNKALSEFKIKSTEKILATYGADQTEVITYYPHPNLDSLAITFTGIDSLQQKIDTVLYIKKDKNERIEETFRVSYTEPQLNLETNAFTFSATFNKPLIGMTLDSIYVSVDSATTIPFQPADIYIDTVNRKLNIKAVIKVDNENAQQLKFHLGKGSLISIDSDSTKREIKNIKTITSESTAILQLHIQTKEPSFIIHLLNVNNTILETRYNETKPTFKYINPENVKIRVIIDTNKNGKWDTANYLTNTEAERVIFYQSEDKKFETPLRANWEVGPLIIKF
jgi:Bacterial Ig-like domain/Polysaccharide lyase family 4, domain II